jgi:hypothetical protein
LAGPDAVDPDAEPPVPPEVRRSARTVRLMLAGLFAVLVGVVGLLGGFGRAPSGSAALPTVPVGQTFDGGQYRITVLSAEFINEMGNRKPKAAGGHILAVEASIDVTDTKTRNVRDILDVQNVKGLVKDFADPSMNYVRDLNLASAVQPGLPEKIWYSWEIAPGVSAPKNVTVVLIAANRQLTNFRFMNYYVEFPAPAATTTVPVTDRSAGDA